MLEDLALSSNHSLRNLKRRLDVAANEVFEGRNVMTRGSQAISDLRTKLGEAGVKLGINFRQVQETVVEQAAMYAKNPEVLGGMLHLAWSFDLIGSWIRERDARVEELEGELRVVECRINDYDAILVGLVAEVKACSKEFEGTCIGQTSEVAIAESTVGSSAEGTILDRRRGSVETATLSKLLADQTCDGKSGLEKMERARGSEGELSGFGTHHAENAVLQATGGIPPVRLLLDALVQLEPLLETLPSGPVRGAAELQSETYHAFGRLQAALQGMASAGEADSRARPVPAATPGRCVGPQGTHVREDQPQFPGTAGSGASPPPVSAPDGFAPGGHPPGPAGTGWVNMAQQREGPAQFLAQQRQDHQQFLDRSLEQRGAAAPTAHRPDPWNSDRWRARPHLYTQPRLDNCYGDASRPFKDSWLLETWAPSQGVVPSGRPPGIAVTEWDMAEGSAPVANKLS